MIITNTTQILIKESKKVPTLIILMFNMPRILSSMTITIVSYTKKFPKIEKITLNIFLMIEMLFLHLDPKVTIIRKTSILDITCLKGLLKSGNRSIPFINHTSNNYMEMCFYREEPIIDICASQLHQYSL